MKKLFKTFAGGEIAPELYGRVELNKYRSGLAKCVNGITLPHGPVTRRPGLQFVAEVKYHSRKVRLIPFVFRNDDALVIELGHQYARFHLLGATVLSGGVPYEITTPYHEDDLFGIRFAQVGDIVVLTHPNYQARELRRYGYTDWRLVPITFTPGISAPASLTVTPTVAQNQYLTPHTYAVTAVAEDDISESSLSAEVTVNNNLGLAGNYNTISWSAVTGAVRYKVYKKRGGWGFIGTTRSTSFVDDNIIPDTNMPPPEQIISLNTTAGEYPIAVCHHEQRRIFGGTLNRPQTLWGTRSGTFNNMTESYPLRKDDAFEANIAASELNAIQHLAPLGDLIVMTQGGEFRVYADGSSYLSPDSIAVKKQATGGASDVRPIIANGAIIYAQTGGKKLRELAYSFEANSYRSLDISVISPHLFRAREIVDMAMVNDPEPIVYCVMSDGKLVGMTYVPEQEVYGFHQHETDGQFESVATIPEDGYTSAYFVVKRGNKRFIEYWPRRFIPGLDQPEDAVFVDSCLFYEGPPTSVLSGLQHLEGKTVQVFADGSVDPPVVVSGGRVVLAREVTRAVVGLPYETRIVTLPLSLEGAEADGMGFMKTPRRAYLRLQQSAPVWVTHGDTPAVQLPSRNAAFFMSSPYELLDGEFLVDLAPGWGTDAQITVFTSDPLPMTLLSIVVDFGTGG